MGQGRLEWVDGFFDAPSARPPENATPTAHGKAFQSTRGQYRSFDQPPLSAKDRAITDTLIAPL
jgi:hypothetical protein